MKLANLSGKTIAIIFFFQAEDGIRDCLLSRGLGDVYKRQVCVPYSMIEPIRTKLNAGFQSEQDEKDNTWGNRFKQNLQKVNVEIVAKLGEMDISVRDFLNLQKDDVLYLEHEVKDPISIEVNGVEKFKGFQGAYKGRKAINVDELIYEPVVDDDMLS